MVPVQKFFFFKFIKMTCSYFIGREEVVSILTLIAMRYYNNSEVPEETPSVSSIESFAFSELIGFKKKR